LTSLHTEGVFDKLSLGLLPGFFSVAEVFGGYRSSLGRVESTLFRVSDDGLQKDDYENEENFLPALSFVDRLGRMTVLTEAEQGNTKFSIFKCIDDAWRRSDSESFTNLSGSVLSIGPQGTPHLLGRLGETSGGLTALIRVRYRDATDLDGDGMSYLLEEAFASDPNDAQEARNICFQLANGTNPQIQCFVPELPLVEGERAFLPQSQIAITPQVNDGLEEGGWFNAQQDIDLNATRLGAEVELLFTQDFSVEDNDAYYFMRLVVTRED